MGPNNWLREAVLMALRSQLGAPYEVPDLRHPGMAARARLILTERFLSGHNRQEGVERALEGAGDDGFVYHPWTEWFKGASSSRSTRFGPS